MGSFTHPLPAADAVELERLNEELAFGSSAQRVHALRRLIESGAETVLTRHLASDNPSVVELAIEGLWECWFNEVGPDARGELESGVFALNEGDVARATPIFERLVAAHPHWAEPVNKLAIMYFHHGQPRESIAWCRRVLALKPDHFGAWNGLAICAIQIEDWPVARRAVDQSLRLQPHSEINRRLLTFVRSRLPD